MLKHPQRSLAAVSIVLALLGGCGSNRITQGTAYPTNLARTHTLDIQVFRRQTRIELTNTTARSFGPSTLWLNARFSKQIDGLAVGQTLEVRLRDFKDEFGESFRGGGFLAAERSERIALAEIQPGDAKPPAMLGMVVVGEED